MEILVLNKAESRYSSGKSCVYLVVDNWNDYSYVTSFQISVHDEIGAIHELGSIKIGFKGQGESIATHQTIKSPLAKLPDNYFSLGGDLEYYQTIRDDLSTEFGNLLLDALNDIVFNEENYRNAEGEKVLKISLLRHVSLSIIKGQFKRVLDGGAPLTDFSFKYARTEEENYSGIDLSFNVKATSKPSTNIHAVIGRNGVGKTTLLNGMIESITLKESSRGIFFDTSDFASYPIEPIDSNYFSSLISVSFSAFDPFDPPRDQSNPELGAVYHYIGLKDSGEFSDGKLKSLSQLHEEFSDSLEVCLSQESKKLRWLRAIKLLESDNNFSAMNLTELSMETGESIATKSISIIKRMSSGHAVVLLTITKLVSRVEEKTLVLVDEPESHLHPPLLSAFTRALSDLLNDRNGVAIIATHSPVVIQEIPKSCVWIITRSRLAVSVNRPSIETFGENVGILTSEVFGLEVGKSGFHRLLSESVEDGKTFDEILEEYDYQLGLESKAVLQSMLLNRKSPESDA